MSQFKTPRRKVVESAQTSTPTSDSKAAHTNTTSVPDPIAAQQKPLTSNDVIYLQRTIGNAATVKLLAGQRQSGATPNAEATKTHAQSNVRPLTQEAAPAAEAAEVGVTLQAESLRIQRFPTRADIESGSDKKSYKKNIVEKAVQKTKGASTFSAVLIVVDEYNHRAGGPVKTTTDLRQKTFSNVLYPLLRDIENNVAVYLKDHANDSKREKTVKRLNKLLEEIQAEIVLLGEIVEDQSYDQQIPGKETVMWNAAVQAHVDKLPNPTMLFWVTALGLPLTFVNKLPKAALVALQSADRYLGASKFQDAAKELKIFEQSQPETYPLVRSALMRKYVNNINPELAAAFNDPNFIQKDANQAIVANSSLNAILPDGTVQEVTAANTLWNANRRLEVFSGGFNAQPSEDDLKGEAKKEILEHQNRQAALDKYYGDKKITPPLKINAGNKEYRGVAQHVENYKQRRLWEQKNVNPAQYGNASDHAKIMVNAYTANFGQFNAPLRGDLTPKAQGGAFSDQNMALTKGIISGLNELPPYEGSVYRHDMVFNGFNELRRVGGVMTDMAVISATREPTSLKLITGSGSAEVLSILKSKTGRFAKPLSSYNSTSTDENEVIFKPGTRFRIVKRVDATVYPDHHTFPTDMETEFRSALNADQEKATIKHILLMEEM